MRKWLESNTRRGRVLGMAVAAGALITIAVSGPPLTAAGPAGPAGAAGAESADRRNRRLMQRQQPLVQAAILIQEEIERGAYDGFAGITLHEDQFVTLWLKDGEVPPSLADVLTEAAQVASVRTGRARYSLAELEAAADEIRGQLGPDTPVHAIKHAGTGEGLIVSVAPSSGLDRAAIVGHLFDASVATEIRIEPPLLPISRNDDSAPWKGGATIVNASIGAGCTSGFGVFAAGRPAVLTAGHCATQNGQRFQDGSGEFIGNAAEKTNHDQLIIPTSSASSLVYVGNRQSNTTKQVTGWEPCFIGELLCQSGVTTAQAIGSELCGLRVESFNTDEESLVEARQVNGQTGARPGDSGGPLYSERANNTVVAKGTMTRVAGSGVGFQDIPTANNDFGGIVIPGAAPPTPPPPPPPPPPGNVQLFQHCNFGGWQANFGITGNVSTAQIQAAGGVNNDASSIRVSPGLSVTLFSGNNQTGQSVTVTGNVACFVGLGFNDVLSSMRIQGAGGGGVVFFQHSNFGGASTQALGPGDYTLSALVARGFVNDWASSARIPAGRTVTMFQHDGFTGTSWTLTGDTSSFSSLSPSANDQVSSVRIR